MCMWLRTIFSGGGISIWCGSEFVAAGHVSLGDWLSGLTCFLVVVGAETSAASVKVTRLLHVSRQPAAFTPNCSNQSALTSHQYVWTWKMDSSWVWEIAASATSGNEMQSKLFPACVLQARVEILLICSDVSLSLALISHCSVRLRFEQLFLFNSNLCQNISPSLLLWQIVNVVISNQSRSIIQYPVRFNIKDGWYRLREAFSGLMR